MMPSAPAAANTPSTVGTELFVFLAFQYTVNQWECGGQNILRESRVHCCGSSDLATKEMVPTQNTFTTSGLPRLRQIQLEIGGQE